MLLLYSALSHPTGNMLHCCKVSPPIDTDMHAIIMNTSVFEAMVQHYWVGVVDEEEKNDSFGYYTWQVSGLAAVKPVAPV